MVTNHVAELQQLQQSIHAWQHEEHNHIQVLYAYLETGQMEQMKQYLATMENEIHQIVQLVNSGNIALDAILNAKLTHAKKLDIHVDYTVALAPQQWMHDMDLALLLGNLLNNALEGAASKKLGERWIRIYIASKQDKLYLYIANPFQGKRSKKNKQYYSTKQDHMGLGRIKIKDIIKKYNGIESTADDQGIFVTEILLDPTIHAADTTIHDSSSPF